MSILLKLLSLLPLWFLYLLSDFLSFLALRVFRYRKDVVIGNLKYCFPEKDDHEINEIVKKFYKNLSDVLVESLKAISISRPQIEKRVRFTNIEIMDEYVEKRMPVVYLTSHQCNWEWMLLGGCVHLPFPIDAMYQKIKAKWAEDLMLKTRGRFGGHPVRSDHTRGIIKRSVELRSVAMVADQVPHIGNKAKYWGKMFNRDTAFYLGGEQLPKLLRSVALFAAPRRVRRGYYEIELIELGRPPYEKDRIEILPRYIKHVENVIRENPGNWLWSHKRWKYTEQEEKDHLSRT
jgi:KDO2-lipid IV(A) lauroyltransferase